MSEPNSQAVQVCKCGCGTVLDLKRSRTDRQFVNASHRARYHREQVYSRVRRDVERGKLPAVFAEMVDELMVSVADLEHLSSSLRDTGQGMVEVLAVAHQRGDEPWAASTAGSLVWFSRSWRRQLQYVANQLERFEDAVLASQLGEDEPAEVEYLVNVLGLAFSWDATDEPDEDEGLTT